GREPRRGAARTPRVPRRGRGAGGAARGRRAPAAAPGGALMREPGFPRPKVALVSIGIGRVQRGFERYFTELFELLRGEIPMTLFRSAGGAGPREVVPPLLGAATAIARRAPLDWLAGHAEYNRDCLAFAA